MSSISFSAVNLTGLRGQQRLFQGCHFFLKAGESLYIKGENGAGKTSLLRLLAGLWEPERGQVYWCERKIGEIKEVFRKNMIFLGHPNYLHPALNSMENLKMNLAIEKNRVISDEEVNSAFLKLGFNLKHAPCYTLSVGQKRRVALSKLLLSPAQLWLLDEPFTGLDDKGIERVRKIMLSHLNQGGIIVYSSHLMPNLESYVYQL